MKSYPHLVLLFSFVLLSIGLKGQQNFTLEAAVTGFPDSTMIIVNRMGIDPRILETEVTLFLKNGKFKFSEKLEHPSKYSIRFHPGGIDDANFTDFEYVFFWAENKPMSLVGRRGEIEYSEISGSEIQDQFEQFVQLEKERKIQVKRLTLSIIKGGAEIPDKEKNEAINAIKEMNKVIDQASIDFIYGHPDFYFTRSNLFLHLWARPEELNQTELRRYYNQLSEAFKNDAYGQTIAKLITEKRSRQLSIGDRFIPFQLPDSTGLEISPADFADKFLLIDFWGSGCGPCLQEHKTYLKAYQKFAAKGFEILSVSIDSKREFWLRAMRRDSMIWKSVWDKSYSVADQYKVNALPTNFLVDPQGTIIAKDLRGETLIKTVEDVLSKNRDSKD